MVIRMKTLANTIDVQMHGPFMLLAHPTEEEYLYGVRAELIRKGSERHFVLAPSDGEDDVMQEGYEASTCLQVIQAYRDEVLGFDVADLHFYAYYANAWRHVSFTEWHPDRISKSWPECDPGTALGVPVVRNIYVRDNPMQDDFQTHPFTYWWHAVRANNQLVSTYEEEISDHYRSHPCQVPFGEITYEAAEVRKYVSLYARDKSILNRRIKAAAGGQRPIYQTPLVQGKKWDGWAVIIVLFDHMQIDHTIYEPGHHNENLGHAQDIRRQLESMGIMVETLSDMTWRINLPTEIDLLKGPSSSRSFVLFRRGEHVFEMRNDEAMSFI